MRKFLDKRGGKTQIEEPQLLYDIVIKQQRKVKHVNEDSSFRWLLGLEVPYLCMVSSSDIMACMGLSATRRSGKVETFCLVPA